jgi:hypothetical protein
MQAEGFLDLSSPQPAVGFGDTGHAAEAVSWELVWGGADGAEGCGEGAATQHAIQPDAATTEEEGESRKKAALAALFAAIPNPAEPSLPIVPPERELDGPASSAPATAGTEEREETAGGNMVASAHEDGQPGAWPEATAVSAETMPWVPERAENKVSVDGQPEAHPDWQPQAVTAPDKDPLTPLVSEKQSGAWPGRAVADVLLRQSGNASSEEQEILRKKGDDLGRSRAPDGSKLTAAGQPSPEPARISAPGAAGERIDGAGRSKPNARIRNGGAVPGADLEGSEGMKSDLEQRTDERLARPARGDAGVGVAANPDRAVAEEESGAHFRPRQEGATQETDPGTDTDFSSASVVNPLRRMDRNSGPGTGSTPGAEARRPAGPEIEPRPSAIRPEGQIDLQIDGQAGERVRIRFAGAPGGIRVRIASNDARLAESLRSGWASLEAALRQAGWEQKEAVSAVAEEAGSAAASVRPGHGGMDFRAGARLGDEGQASVTPSPSQDASEDKPGDGRSGQGRPDTENETREEWLELSALRRLARRRQE